MKKIARTGCIALIALMTVSLFGCHSEILVPPTPSAKLVSIHINPVEKALGATEATIPAGYTQSYAAEGTYSDNSVKDITGLVSWHSSDETIASTSANIATGVSSGDTIITAALGDISSNQSGLKVTDAILMSIQLTADKDNTTLIADAKGGVKLIAMGTFSDDTQLDVAADSENDWVFNPDLVSIKNGIATGIAKGDDTVSVRRGDVVSNDLLLHVKALEKITISTKDDKKVPVGLSIAFKASGTFSDGTTADDITSQVTWLSDNTDAATFASSKLTGKAVGTTNVTAIALSARSNRISIEVTDPVITALKLSINDTDKDTSTIRKEEYQGYTVTATYNNHTTHALTNDTAITWDITKSAVASKVARMFALHGDAVGETDLIVSTSDAPAVTSNKVHLTVTDAKLVSIAITPNNDDGNVIYVSNKGTVQLRAIGTYADASTNDITSTAKWGEGNSEIATVVQGLVSGVKTASNGQTIKTNALLDGVVSDNNVTVTVEACEGLGCAKIDIFDTGGGKLFTNSPSRAYLDSIGGSIHDDTYTEDGTTGPSGNFYQFNRDHANRLCGTYNGKSLGGRTNWRLPEKDELSALYRTADGADNGMFGSRGWPINRSGYWAITPWTDNQGYAVNLSTGTLSGSSLNSTQYVSCVSNPPDY